MSQLKNSAVSGVKWSATSTTFIAISAPLFQIIKARFIGPEGFAYIAIITIVIGFMSQLEGRGFNAGIIQKDHVKVEEASSLLIFNLIIAAVMGGVLLILASPVAVFLEMPELELYLSLVSILVFLSAPKRYLSVFLRKFFLFKEIALMEIFRQGLVVIIATSLLIMGWGVLGFVWGHIIAAFLSLLLLVYFAVKHKVTGLRFYFRINSLRPFLRFGVFVSGRSFLQYFAQRMDEVVIGYFLDPDILGVYYFGKSMLLKLMGLISNSYSKVLFPLFSKLKHDPQRFSDVYFKLTRYVAIFAFPVFIGVALTAQFFVPVVFGEEWMESVIVFQVFAVALIFKMVTAGMAGNVLYAVNRPDTAFYLDIVTDFVYFVGLLVFSSWGMHAVLVTYSSYIVIKMIVFQVVTLRHLTGGLVEFLSLFKGVGLYTLAMIAGVWGFQQVAAAYAGDLFILIGSVVVGAAIYIPLTWVFDQKSIKEIRKLAKSG